MTEVLTRSLTPKSQSTTMGMKIKGLQTMSPALGLLNCKAVLMEEASQSVDIIDMRMVILMSVEQKAHR